MSAEKSTRLGRSPEAFHKHFTLEYSPCVAGIETPVLLFMNIGRDMGSRCQRYVAKGTYCVKLNCYRRPPCCFIIRVTEMGLLVCPLVLLSAVPPESRDVPRFP